MPYRFSYAIILFFSLLSISITASGQNNYEIRRIRFKGNKAFDKTTLKDQLAISSTNAYERIIKKRESSLYDPNLIDFEVVRLRSFYQSEGYLHADASIDTLILKEKKKRNKVDIHFKITENKYVTVDSLTFTVSDTTGKIKDNLNERLKKRLLLQKGKRFSDANLHNDVNTIKEVYVALGYVYANVTFKLHLDEKQEKVCVLFNITPGKICQFGEVTISGNKYTKESFIRKQLTFETGDRYSNRIIDKSRSQIYDLQNFRIVSVSPQTNYKTKANPIPIQITIQEVPRWMTKFGIGYGSEDQFRASADITYRGLFGGTSRLNLYAKYSSIYPYHVSLAWIEPRFFANKLSVSVNPYIEKINDPAYSIQRFGINVPVTYTFNRFFSAALTYYFERVKDETDYNKEGSESEEITLANFYNKSGFSTSFTFTNARPVTSPEKGWTVTLGGKINGYIFGGEYDYFKYWVDVRKYFKVRRFAFAMRGMGGAILNKNGIPVEDLFYSGGGNSNRGWKRSELGPIGKDGRPTGGKSVIEMNFEVRHPLFWRIELAAFVDFGNAWNESAHYELKNLEYSVGGGIRIATPIGPIRVDVGVPVGSENKTGRVILSVGQAF